MRFLATFFLVLFGVHAAFSQAPKPKASQKPKTVAAKSKTSDKSKPAAKPKNAPVQSKKPTEKTEWEKAIAISDNAARLAALKKFVAAFPKSLRIAEANGLIVVAGAAAGGEKLAAGDIPGAAAFYKTAVNKAPFPIPATLYDETLSKFAANLYFRGARDEAIAIARVLEEKSAANAAQLLSIAAFYMSVENGSEAKRIAENVIKLTPDSTFAYQTLGLANRIDFNLDDSAAAYAKAIELDPDSIAARRGSAEMKRALGRPDEAAALYREILAKEPENVPAQTGLVLSLFDAGKRTDAEAELTRSLDANSGNVILLAGAAYWYAANNDGSKAVEYAEKAIASDPRFIWSHIALARGLVNKDDPVAAERVLLAARQYGNFPTLEYEIATARFAAGYYREAAEELAKSFTVKDGTIRTNLGGRVGRESKNFTELVGFERRASIFAPTAADSPDNAAKLTALLEFKQEMGAAEPKADAALRFADELVKGDDNMKVHRQIFAASQLLEKKIGLAKVVELSKAAAANVDAGLNVTKPAVAVMAGELYENRQIAAGRGEYLNIPEVPRATLGAILRGEIEELYGWATYHLENPEEAVIRLKRAVSVLPVDSTWWRRSTWRLGTALEADGKDAEALNMYIRSYHSRGPDAVSYGVIEALYKKINGSTDGLEAKAGPRPVEVATGETVAVKTEPAPEPSAQATPEATPEAIPSPTAALPPISSSRITPNPTRIPSIVPISTPEAVEAASPEPTPASTMEPTAEPTAAATPDVAVVEPDAEPIAAATPPTEVDVKPAIIAEQTPQATPEPSVQTPTPSPDATPGAEKTSEETRKEIPVADKPAETAKSLFPPVIINIPSPVTTRTSVKDTTAASPSPSPTPVETEPDVPAYPVASASPTPEEVLPTATPEETPEKANEKRNSRPRIVESKAVVKPCTLNVSDDSITLQTGGGDLAVIVGIEGGGEIEGITATSSNPDYVTVRREPITRVSARALFVVRAANAKIGMYQIRFEMPCGKKDILVKVM